MFCVCAALTGSSLNTPLPQQYLDRISFFKVKDAHSAFFFFFFFFFARVNDLFSVTFDFGDDARRSNAVF